MQLTRVRLGVRTKNTRSRRLLHNVAGAGVPRVNRFTPGEAFVLPVVKADAIFPELPAEINVLVINHRGKIKQSHLEVLDETSGFKDALQRAFQGGSELLVLYSQSGQLFIRDDHPAHHHDSCGYRG